MLVSGCSDAVQLGLQGTPLILRLRQLSLQSFTHAQQLNHLGLGFAQLFAECFHFLKLSGPNSK